LRISDIPTAENNKKKNDCWFEIPHSNKTIHLQKD